MSMITPQCPSFSDCQSLNTIKTDHKLLNLGKVDTNLSQFYYNNTNADIRYFSFSQFLFLPHSSPDSNIYNLPQFVDISQYFSKLKTKLRIPVD